jgi:hypothetical protein
VLDNLRYARNSNNEGVLMDIHEVMRRFNMLDYSLSSGGPLHPKYPNKILERDVARLWDTYPALKQDQGFVDFIEAYSGAFILYPDNSLFVSINGLWDYTAHLLFEEGVYDGHYIVFSEILLDNANSSEGSISGIGFAFKLTEMPGVYRHLSFKGDNPRKQEGYEPYCDTFAEWLDRLVKAKGRLVD